jgi:hypothetical protein
MSFAAEIGGASSPRGRAAIGSTAPRPDEAVRRLRAGLQDGSSRSIDGDHDGAPGGNAVAILSRGGASIAAIPAATTDGQSMRIMALVDALFERDAFAGLTTARRPRCVRPAIVS